MKVMDGENSSNVTLGEGMFFFFPQGARGDNVVTAALSRL